VRHFDLAAAKQPRVDLIAIAASTGGPPALERVLGGLPKKFPPVVIAQHLAPSFSKGFADWLAGALGREVASASLRMRLEESTIYVAGEGQHVMVQDGYVMPRNRRANDLTPNADVLFESVAASAGRGAVGIVLTGMGNDGAEGLKAMKDAGAWTIAQDAESSVVYGMPRVAWESGACCEQLPLDVIGARLVALLKGNE
jgi:two-component system chemotaxis response regulator CheB